MVQKQASKQQAEKHDQAPYQIGNASIPEDYTDEETDTGCCQIEKNKDKDEFKKLRPCGNQPGHWIYDDTHDDRRDESQRHYIEKDLGGEVGHRVVVAIGALTHKQQTLRGEHSETGQSTESKEGQDKEEQAQAVLETLDIIRQAVEEVSAQYCKKNRNRIVRQHEHGIPV